MSRLDGYSLFHKSKKNYLNSVYDSDEGIYVHKAYPVNRLREHNAGSANAFESTMLQILSYCDKFGLLHVIEGMVEGNMISKAAWKQIVLDKAWERVERRHWYDAMVENRYLDLISLTMDHTSYSVWWIIADNNQRFMKKCEVMIKLLCHASLLKEDDSRLKSAPFGSKCCILCDNAAHGSANHMVMQCSFNEGKRADMLREIYAIYPGMDAAVTFSVLMGKHIEGCDPENMLRIWITSCRYIAQMYYDVLNARKE